jgi:hypothetical protein
LSQHFLQNEDYKLGKNGQESDETAATADNRNGNKKVKKTVIPEKKGKEV